MSDYSVWLKETARQAEAVWTLAENEEIHHQAEHQDLYGSLASLCKRILEREVAYDIAIARRS